MGVSSIDSRQAWRLDLTGEAAIDPLTGTVHLTPANFAPGGGTPGEFASLAVTGNATVGGTLAVIGATTAAALSCTTLAASGAVTCGTTLGVTGATTMTAASCTTLAASGAVTCGTTLGVTGASTLAATSCTTLAASGAVTCGTTLGVTGASTLAAVACTTLAASGAVTCATTLGVTGASTLTGAVTLGAGLTAASGDLASQGLSVNSGQLAVVPAGISMLLVAYADNAAALAGGLVVNNLYKTATGELRIVV